MEMQLIGQTNSIASSLCLSKSNDDFDEASLIAGAKTGSLGAFEQLVKRYEARVFRVAQSMAHTREDAEEVAQSAFVQAFSHLSNFRGDSRFYTWLVRITINEGLMKLRRRRYNEISIDNARENEEGILPRELEDSRPTPEERCSREELRSILATTIGQLSPRYRAVFQLRDVEGFSTKETARALDLSLTAVKTRLRRARVALRSSLQKYTRSFGVIQNQRSQRFSAFIGSSRS
jgi:RNA polymerase sigma-70 factor, ECF subfamily